MSQLALFNLPPAIPRPTEPVAKMPEPEWTEDQGRVYRALLRHQGRAKAIKCDLLADVLDIPSRRLQKVIHDLIHEHGVAVGSAMAEPYGYYLARSESELEAVAEMFDRRSEAIQETGDKLRTRGKAELERRIREAAA